VIECGIPFGLTATGFYNGQQITSSGSIPGFDPVQLQVEWLLGPSNTILATGTGIGALSPTGITWSTPGVYDLIVRLTYQALTATGINSLTVTGDCCTTKVDEPDTLVLFGAGIVGVWAVRRYRRRRAAAQNQA
jgi:hypothetical protein